VYSQGCAGGGSGTVTPPVPKVSEGPGGNDPVVDEFVEDEVDENVEDGVDESGVDERVEEDVDDDVDDDDVEDTDEAVVSAVDAASGAATGVCIASDLAEVPATAEICPPVCWISSGAIELGVAAPTVRCKSISYGIRLWCRGSPSSGAETACDMKRFFWRRHVPSPLGSSSGLPRSQTAAWPQMERCPLSAKTSSRKQKAILPNITFGKRRNVFAVISGRAAS
jgi:hypothetical protein